MANSNSSRTLVIVGLVALVVIIALAALTAPDRRGTGERVSDAVSELPNGVDNATRELGDRTPGQRVGNAVEDAGESIKRNTN